MKNYEKVLGEAVRVEYEEESGKLFLVFEITDASFKNEIKKDWTQDIELKIVKKELFLNE